MKRMMTWLLLTTLMCTAMAGCEKKEDSISNRDYHMYYIDETQTQVVAEPYEPEPATTEELVEVFIKNQSKDPGTKKKTYGSILPEGVTIHGFELQGGLLQLDMSASYSEMSFTREIVARVGLVRTFTQIPAVTRVEILVDGETLKDQQGNAVGAMYADYFVESSGKDINTYQNITMTLYFANSDGTKLVSEKRSVNYSTNVPLERFVVEQLVRGPKVEGHNATLPADTRILSVTVSEGTCYINFDSSIETPMVNVKEEVQLYSIVNSLAEVCQVQQVKFSINGEGEYTFRDKVELGQLFTWDESYIEKDDK